MGKLDDLDDLAARSDDADTANAARYAAALIGEGAGLAGECRSMLSAMSSGAAPPDAVVAGVAARTGMVQSLVAMRFGDNEACKDFPLMLRAYLERLSGYYADDGHPDALLLSWASDRCFAAEELAEVAEGVLPIVRVEGVAAIKGLMSEYGDGAWLAEGCDRWDARAAG